MGQEERGLVECHVVSCAKCSEICARVPDDELALRARDAAQLLDDREAGGQDDLARQFRRPSAVSADRLD